MNRWKIIAIVAVLVFLPLAWLTLAYLRDDEDGARRGAAADRPAKHRSPISALDAQLRPKATRPPQVTAATPAAVTMTWGALRAQTPIPLPGGGTARIGFEASSAPASSGVFVYCLIDDPTGQSPTRRGHLPLGPFSVEVRGPLVQQELDQLEIQRAERLTEDGQRLYVQAIPIDVPGDYHVGLRLDEPGALAGVDLVDFVITGTAAPFHRWLPFGAAGEIEEFTDGAEAGTPHARLAVLGDGSAAAIPSADGFAPIAFSGEAGQAIDDDTESLQVMQRMMLPDEGQPSPRLSNRIEFRAQSSGSRKREKNS